MIVRLILLTAALSASGPVLAGVLSPHGRFGATFSCTDGRPCVNLTIDGKADLDSLFALYARWGIAGAEREFIRALPMTYDESVALEAEIGDHVTMARRKGRTWYAAGLCGTRAHAARLDCGFLGEGSWDVTLFRDGKPVEGGWTPVERKTLRVTKADELQVEESACGGFVLLATPAS